MLSMSVADISQDAKGQITSLIEIAEEGKTVATVSIMSKDMELNKHLEAAIKRSLNKLK